MMGARGKDSAELVAKLMFEIGLWLEHSGKGSCILGQTMKLKDRTE